MDVLALDWLIHEKVSKSIYPALNFFFDFWLHKL